MFFPDSCLKYIKVSGESSLSLLISEARVSSAKSRIGFRSFDSTAVVVAEATIFDCDSLCFLFPFKILRWRQLSNFNLDFKGCDETDSRL